MMIFVLSHGNHPIPASLVGFLLGETVFVVNAVFLLFWKLLTMTVCWSAAVFIAPIGLAYLYYHHSKNGSVPQSERH
jgi:hypothetical protein